MKTAVHQSGHNNIQDRKDTVARFFKQKGLYLEYASSEIKGDRDKEADVDSARYREFRQDRGKADQGKAEELRKDEVLPGEPVH